MQIIWQPYTEVVMQLLPDICRSDSQVWRSRVPLICFDVVEFHVPDRVLRQFGYVQTIPSPIDTDDALHKKDRRRRCNWLTTHARHLTDWDARLALVVQGTPWVGPSPLLEEYIAWYRTITRLIITPPAQQRPPTAYQPATADFLLV